MATSPDYLRLASSANRALADIALDALHDAVLVVDSRVKHLPVVLANKAARDALSAGGESTSSLIEVPLLRLMGADSIVTFEWALSALLHAKSAAESRRPPESRLPTESRLPADPKFPVDLRLPPESGLLPQSRPPLDSNAPMESRLKPGSGALPSFPQVITRSLVWKSAQGEQSHLTDIKLLAGAAGHPTVMLSFAPIPSDVVAAVNQLPLDMLILDPDLRVTYANAGAMRMSAAVPGGVLGATAMNLTPTSALDRDVFARALEGQPFHNDAVAFNEPDQPMRWFEVSVQPLHNGASIVGLVVLYAEATERRMRSRAQGGTERRMLALTEHALDIITVADGAGRLQYVSGGVRNSLGYTSEERRSNSLFEHMHPDDSAQVRVQYNQLVAGETDSFTKEVRIRHKNGGYRWLESSYVSALSNPMIGGVVINSRDITERKEAEFKLAQREEVFRLAADAVDGVVFEWDIPRGTVHRSRGVQEVLGILPEDLEPSTDAWQERVHPLDAMSARRLIGIALMRGRGWEVSYRIRDARGAYRSILERGLIQRNAVGDPVRAIGTCVDVSEIKRLTDILAESQRTARIGGWEYSCGSHNLTWTDELYRIFDTTPKELTPSWDVILERCVPDSAERLQAALSRAAETAGPLDLEFEINTFKGRRTWIRAIGHVENLDGRPFRSYGSMQDIQTQKVSQIALENSTGWLKLSMNMAHLHAWRWEKANDTFEFTTLEGNQVRLPSVYPGMAKMISRVHPKDQPAVRRAIDRAFEQNLEVCEEFLLQGADGHYRAYASTARPLFDAAKAPLGMVGVIQDITLRRDSERRLRQSEELLRTTTANTADTLFLLDTSLRVRFINRSVNGLGIEDIIGNEVDLLLPRAARARVLKKLRRILQTGETATYEFEWMENGEPHYFENHAVAVREDGIGAGISISMREITERKRLEQEILDVSARERQSIGRDLHDGLGQELTGVALMLRSLATRIQTRCPDVVENVNEVVGLVNQSIDTARALAHGLLPVRTESGGLSAALRALAERGRDVYGLAVNFSGEMSPECPLNDTDASHLYRIAQEALTNAARHGRATRVDVELLTNAHSFVLRIRDDGVGVRLPVTSTGMGLKIMKYRAGMIGAKLDIGADEPRGAVITVASERSVPSMPVGVNSGTAISGDDNDGGQQCLGSNSGGGGDPSFRGQHR